MGVVSGSLRVGTDLGAFAGTSPRQTPPRRKVPRLSVGAQAKLINRGRPVPRRPELIRAIGTPRSRRRPRARRSSIAPAVPVPAKQLSPLRFARPSAISTASDAEWEYSDEPSGFTLGVEEAVEEAEDEKSPTSRCIARDSLEMYKGHRSADVEGRAERESPTTERIATPGRLRPRADEENQSPVRTDPGHWHLATKLTKASSADPECPTSSSWPPCPSIQPRQLPSRESRLSYQFCERGDRCCGDER